MAWGATRSLRAVRWVQVEVTSRCQAACAYCPHTAYRGVWGAGDLEPALLERALEGVPRKAGVQLQGWGEPTLHPELERLVASAARAGHPVATATNAVALDPERVRRLAEAGLDLLAVSLAGVGRDNDRVRRGTSARQALSLLEAVASRRAREGGPAPRLHVAYMLLASGLGELPAAVRALAGAGADAVVVSSLDLVPDAALAAESLWHGGVHRGRLAEAVAAAHEAARETGVELVVRLATGRPGRCAEGPDRQLVVGWDGTLYRCIYTALPVAAPVRHWTPRGPALAVREPFGDLRRERLAEAWARREARRLRRRAAAGRNPPPRCRVCGKREVEAWPAPAPPALVPELG